MTDNPVAFAGSIPQNYDRYLGPMVFEPYADDLVRRVRVDVGDAILEIACGTGIVTTRLVQALPLGASLTASDLNEPMIEVARRKIDASEPVTWKTADACALPFGDEWFSTVVCQYGVMFFPDKPAALREVYRVLQPGGTFVFNVWNSLAENPLASITNDVLAEFFPANPPPFSVVPYGMTDVDATRALLEQAGFASIEATRLPLMARSDSARDAATGVVLGTPLVVAIQERDPAATGRIIDAVAARLAQAGGESPLTLPMSAHVFTAQRP
jgi:ubiquinone/menaquinone biosynthesis C-methylase UbiE